MIGRLKFNIDPLVNLILDQIPEDLIINGVILDPAIGGGQFVKEIERRKRAAGKTEKEIKATVFGIEENILRRDYSVNKHKLAGTYSIENFLEKDFNNMKFDVIVGNPPYQGDQKHAYKIWPTITNKALKLLKPNGYIGWVIPSGWLESNNAQMKKVRTQLTSHYNLLSINRNANNYFNVGTDILNFVATHSKYTGHTVYVEGSEQEVIDLRHGLPKTADDLMIENIISKVVDSDDPRLDLKDEPIPSSEVQPTATAEYCYPIIYSTANRGYTKNKLANDGQLKLAVNLSSSYYSDKTADNNMPITTTAIGALMCYIPINNAAEGQMIKSYLSSKLIRFVALLYKRKNTGFNHAVRQRRLPQLDLKIWTDQEVYQHFGLTQQEIDYVESIVK